MAYKMNLVHQPPPCPSYADTVRLFLEHGCLDEATKVALDAIGSLEGSEALDASLQTRIVEEHLSRHAPHGAVARIAMDCHGLPLMACLIASLIRHAPNGVALIQTKSLPDFEPFRIAQRCEALKLMPIALKLYTAVEDVARVMCHDAVGDKSASERVASLSPADGLACLRALLRKKSSEEDAQLQKKAYAKALAVARTHADLLGHTNVVSALEELGSDAGLLNYLQARMGANPAAKDLTLEYLRVAKRAGRVDELERITREPGAAYEPQAVLALLDEPTTAPSWLADPRPVINVCDRHDLIEQMAGMFHRHAKYGHLKLYLQHINPGKAPQVTAGLLDAGCDAARVGELLKPLGLAELKRDASLVTRLIKACEERKQLPLLAGWLNARKAEMEAAAVWEEPVAGAAAASTDPTEVLLRVELRQALLKAEPPKAKGFWG
jgi:clathrin heavy chain